MNTIQSLKSQVSEMKKALKIIANGVVDSREYADEVLQKVRVLEKSVDAEMLFEQGGVKDWELERGESEVAGDVDAARYDIKLSRISKNQFSLSLSPSGVAEEEYAGKNVLGAMIEIDGGLPCLHVGNNPLNGPLLTVYSNASGLVVRQDAGDYVSKDDASKLLRDVIDGACATSGYTFGISFETGEQA